MTGSPRGTEVKTQSPMQMAGRRGGLPMTSPGVTGNVAVQQLLTSHGHGRFYGNQPRKD